MFYIPEASGLEAKDHEIQTQKIKGKPQDWEKRMEDVLSQVYNSQEFLYSIYWHHCSRHLLEQIDRNCQFCCTECGLRLHWWNPRSN